MIWPLVGRDRELGSVGELLAEGAAGGVLVSGAAGVGKTRLAVEVAGIAESRGCAVEWVRATRSAASIPLGAFAALVAVPESGSAAGVELLARARQHPRRPARRAGSRRDLAPGRHRAESCEFASCLAAERHDIAHVRVALGLACAEEEVLSLAAPAVDDLRLELGLPADPNAERIRSSPYVSLIPPGLEHPSAPGPSWAGRRAAAG